MPGPVREQNDFGPVYSPFPGDAMRDPGDDPFVPPDYPVLSDIVEAAEMEGGMPEGSTVALKILGQYEQEMLVAEKAIVELVDTMGRNANEERKRRGMHTWIDRADRRARGSDGLDILYAATDGATWSAGDIIGGEDAPNRRCGRSLGLIPEAMKSAVAVLHEYLFDGDRLPLQLEATGSNDENSDKEALMEMAIEDQLEHGHFKGEIVKALWDFVQYPYCCVRQQWKTLTTLAPGEDTGTLEEQIVHDGVRVRRWRPQDVWFSDYDQSSMEQQRWAIFYSEVTLGELEAEEAFLATPERFRMGPDGSVATARLVSEKGRFRGMDRIRRRFQERSGTEQAKVDATDFTWIDERPGQRSDYGRMAQSAEVKFGLMEQEGRLPLSSLVYKGIITPFFLDYWGIDIGDYAQMTKREVAIRLERIDWNFAATVERHLLQLEAGNRGKNEPRLSCVTASYFPGDGLLGQGIPQATWDANELADLALNELVYNLIHRSRGKWAVNGKKLMLPNGREISQATLEKFLRTPEQVLHYEGNVDVRTMFDYLIPESIMAETQAQIDFQKARVEAISNMTEQLKGTTQGVDTAAESNNLQAGAMRLGRHSGKIFGERIIEELGRGILRSFSMYMEATGDLNKPGSWEEYALKVAGELGLKSGYLMPTLDNIVRQFIVIHSGSPMGRKDLVVGFLGQMLAEDTHLVLDPREVRRRQFSLMDERSPDKLILGVSEPRQPNVEIRAFANDHYLLPVEGENLIDHYITHILQLMALDVAYLLDLGGPEAILQLVAQAGGPDRAMRLFADLQEWGKLSGQVPPVGLENYWYDSHTVGPTLLQHTLETEGRLSALVSQMQMAAAQAQIEAGGKQKGLPAPGGGTEDGARAPLGPEVTDQSDLMGATQRQNMPEVTIGADSGA